MHCNPAPPHPPPGELYNVMCLGRPYIDGWPVGYAFLGVGLLGILFIYWIRWRYSEINL